MLTESLGLKASTLTYVVQFRVLFRKVYNYASAGLRTRIKSILKRNITEGKRQVQFRYLYA
jgi:hypothetical protein